MLLSSAGRVKALDRSVDESGKGKLCSSGGLASCPLV